MTPCIILHNRALDRYEAYNEDGRLVRWSESYVILSRGLEYHDYSQVSLNSRLGRTIFDKLPLTVQMRVQSES